MYDMDIPTYVTKLQEMNRNNIIQKKTQILKERYPDSSDVLLIQNATNSVDQFLNQRKQSMNSKKQETQSTVKDSIANDIRRLESKYESFDVSKLPETVLNLVQEGYTLFEAYELNEKNVVLEQNKALNEKMKALEKNNSNANKTIGKVSKTLVAEQSDDDIFMSSF